MNHYWKCQNENYVIQRHTRPRDDHPWRYEYENYQFYVSQRKKGFITKRQKGSIYARIDPEILFLNGDDPRSTDHVRRPCDIWIFSTYNMDHINVRLIFFLRSANPKIFLSKFSVRGSLDVWLWNRIHFYGLSFIWFFWIRILGPWIPARCTGPFFQQLI